MAIEPILWNRGGHPVIGYDEPTDQLVVLAKGGLGGGGLTFPANAVPVNDPNTLDDYEEGNWTPTISGLGGGVGTTYAARDGRYTKIGRLVYIQGRIDLSAVGTLTGQVTISGLPFPIANSGPNAYPIMNIMFFNLAIAKTQMYGLGSLSAGPPHFFTIFTLPAAGGVTEAACVQADLAATSILIFAACYHSI